LEEKTMHPSDIDIPFCDEAEAVLALVDA